MDDTFNPSLPPPASRPFSISVLSAGGVAVGSDFRLTHRCLDRPPKDGFVAVHLADLEAQADKLALQGLVTWNILDALLLCPLLEVRSENGQFGAGVKINLTSLVKECEQWHGVDQECQFASNRDPHFASNLDPSGCCLGLSA